MGNFASFSPILPTHLRLVYDPTETILVILYGEVLYMLPAKSESNRLVGSGVEVI